MAGLKLVVHLVVSSNNVSSSVNASDSLKET